MRSKKIILWLMTHVQSPNFLKKLFSNSWEFLLIKLPNPPGKYNLQSVISYDSSFTILDYFRFNNTSEEKVQEIMTNIESSKGTGVDKLSGRLWWNQHISETHFNTLQSLTRSLAKCLQCCETETYF